MSNERTDEFLSWRGRLDQPGALPEQGLDNHEASWQRLAERLHEKRRRRGIGYWVAAACLLLALIPAVCFLHPGPPATVLRSPARQRTAVQTVATRPLPVEHAGTPVTHPAERPLLSSAVPSNVLCSRVLSQAIDSIIGPTAPPAIATVAIAAPDIKPATDSHQLMAIPRTELPLLVSAVSLSGPNATLALLGSTGPSTGLCSRVLLKKQLKVVYYNEISNPSGPSPSTAARIPAFLKFSIGRSGSPESGGESAEQANNDPVLTI